MTIEGAIHNLNWRQLEVTNTGHFKTSTGSCWTVWALLWWRRHRSYPRAQWGVCNVQRESFLQSHPWWVCTFLAILLVSGYSTAPQRRMYWWNDTGARNAAIAPSCLWTGLTKSWYYQYHVSDNNDLDAEDKMSKIRPLITMIDASSSSWNNKTWAYMKAWVHTMDVTEPSNLSEASQSSLDYYYY